LVNLLGCEPPVTFEEPQPTNTANLSKFPKRLHGKYLSLNDSSMLLIDSKLILRIYDYNDKVHTNQLDSSLQLSGDTLINLETNEKTKIERKGDTLIHHIHYIDTLFYINIDNVVRKFKGYYFLNIRYGELGWSVKKMELVKGQLVVSIISAKEDIENLKEITESPTDTVPPFKFRATKKQFVEFIKNDGFSDSEIFVKQKKNSQ